MKRPVLSDQENARAYQTLCDCPSGSTRSWAAKAGWTKSRMERFLLQLRADSLARIDTGPMGSIFVPLGVSDTVPDSVSDSTPYLGSKSDSDKVPRYGESPRQAKADGPAPDVDVALLIATANVVLTEREWETLRPDNFGSIAGAKKILATVPIDRAIPLLEAAVRAFNPSSTGGDTLKSLGHPFITRYVINEYRRRERELTAGQLPILFVEGKPLHVYGARKHDERPPAKPETIAAGVDEFRAIATSAHKPQRMK